MYFLKKSNKSLEIIGILALMLFFLLAAIYNVAGETDGVIFATGCCFCLGLLFTKVKAIHGFYSLSIICLVALTVYSMAIPVHQVFFRDYDDATVRFVTLMCAVSVVAMVIGLRLANMGKGKFGYMINDSNKIPAIKFGFFIVIVGLFSYFCAIYLTVGFRTYFDAGYAGRALVKRFAGPVELGLYYMVIGYLFVLYSFLFEPKKRNHFLGVFLFLFLIGYVVFISSLGIRRPSFFIVVSALVLIFFKARGKVPILIIGVSLTSLFLFAIFAQFRQVLSDHGVSSTIEYLFLNFDLEWLDLSSSELGAPFRAMMDVNEDWFSKGCGWGVSYIEAMINILPSGFGFTAQSLSVQYTNEFFSDEYIAIGGNMGFFPVAEAYLNFGVIGVFFEFLLIGVVIKQIENSAFINGGVVRTVFYATIAPWFFFFMRTDFSSFLKSFFYSILPVFVMYYLLLIFFSILSKYRVVE